MIFMPNIPPLILKRARALRHRPTKSEEIFWNRVRNRQIPGLKFRRQVPIHGHVVDFACLMHRLIVEIDGGVHRLPEVQVRDQDRDFHLMGLGYHVLRFSDRANLEELETVVGLIEDYVRKRHPLTPPKNPPRHETQSCVAAPRRLHRGHIHHQAP
ncbi:endonuclease domain-containing protein [Aquidulcibacter sp.]|uniref:endonuclease domain-containing protein n=1 Tax=Aquidulcibacter sp. TaxID=2052990 RepID=UPI00345D05E8|nr:DUF559 domain-containing protein [Aquidulcibacter sp.]